MMGTKRFILFVFIIVGLITTYSWAEFSDDFSNPANSNTQWVKGADFITIEFKNGVCKVINTDANFIGTVLHTFPAEQKPSLFTLSAQIEIVEGSSAGLAFCLKSGSIEGYYATIEKNYITVTKIKTTGESEILFNARSAYLKEKGSNQLKISKKENIFNIFCNDKFVGTFTDNTFSSGEIALLVNTKTTAIFDNIVMTDSFTEGKPITCFADNFDKGELIGWSYFGDDNVEIGIYQNSLKIKTKGNENAYLVVDMPLRNFVARIVVSHHGGSTKNLYGLFICGDPTSSTIPMVGFGINGARQYAIFEAGKQFTTTVSSAIKGAPFISDGDTFYYKDTLEIIKRENSDDYIFVVNKDTLSKYNGLSFNITGIGIFSLDSIEVYFDDFIAVEGTQFSCNTFTITKENNFYKEELGRSKYLLYRNEISIFDCLGREISKGKKGIPLLRNGIYLTREAKFLNISKRSK